MIQSLQRLTAVLALLLSLLAPAHASAMLDPGLGRFNQRDPHPDTYPDGMNAYAAYHVMRGGVDPWGLKNIVLVASHRQNNVNEDEFDTFAEMLEARVAGPWNKELQEIITYIRDHPEITSYELNGEKVSRDEAVKYLDEQVMEIRVLPKLHGDAVKAIYKAAAEVGEYGELTIEAHSVHEPNIDGVNVPIISVGENDRGDWEWIPAAELLEGLSKNKLESHLVLGSCNWRKEDLEDLVKGNDFSIHGTGDGKHRILYDLDRTGKIIRAVGLRHGHTMHVEAKEEDDADE